MGLTDRGTDNVIIYNESGVTLGDATTPFVVYGTDTVKATYSSASTALVPPASPTDIFTITGSVGKTIRVTRLAISGTQTTAATRDILLIKRSTANTGGTSTTLTNVAHDSTSAASSATIRAYTVNPTSLGTAVGTVRTRKVFVAGTATNSDEFIVEWGPRNAQSIVLRGVNEVLAVNLNGATSAGNNFNINIEWTEE